jgi:hypothetical protein
MKKNDSDLKEITLAAIKRHTVKPFDFKYTNLYEENASIEPEVLKTLYNIYQHPDIEDFIDDLLNMEAEEAFICSTIISEQIWTILTTRRIISREGVGIFEHKFEGIKNTEYADFKGYSRQEFTKGLLVFNDDKIIPLFIETGNASMVMIYGTGTLEKLTDSKNHL